VYVLYLQGNTGKAWLAWQAPLFFGGVICALVSLGWQFVMHPKHALRVNNYTELGYMALRYVCWNLAFGYLVQNIPKKQKKLRHFIT